MNIGFGNKKKGTMGSQYGRTDRGITRRPADAPQPDPVKAPVQQNEQQPAQTPEQKFAQMLIERGLSQVSLKYKDMTILILHEIDPGKEPQRIEKVIERWHNLPGGSRFDVLSFKRHIYCISNETGRIDTSVELPEKHAQLAQEEQDEKVRAFMAELTGEQPAAPAAGVLTAELLNSTPDDVMEGIFYDMPKKERQRVIDLVMKANKRRVIEAQQRRQPSGDGSEEQPKKAPQPKPQPKPAPQRQPAAPQATTGVASTRRRRGG